MRLLKTSPVNAQLMNMYNAQSVASALWGLNTITVTDSQQNDLIIAQKVAFKKAPSLTYAKEAGFNEWTFDAISLSTVLGEGQ